MKWFLQRLTEASSQAGLGLVASGVLAATHGDIQTGGVQIVMGVLAFIRAEAGAK